MSAIRMLCLANSRKHGGRCVAGLVWDGKNYTTFIRPIVKYGHGELGAERFYFDGSDPKPLDVIELEVLGANPVGCHVEDVVIDDKRWWQKRGTIAYEEAVKYVSTSSSPLWIDGNHTQHGENDCISAGAASKLKSSLSFIAPASLELEATLEHESRKIRGTFRLGVSRYRLSVTDSRIETEFAALAVGSKRTVIKPLLCISVGEVFEKTNACYKLIAGVMEK